MRKTTHSSDEPKKTGPATARPETNIHLKQTLRENISIVIENNKNRQIKPFVDTFRVNVEE